MYLGDTLNNLKRWREAVEIYKSALQLLGPHSSILSRLGDTTMNLKDFKEASKYYSISLKGGGGEEEKDAASFIGLLFSNLEMSYWEDYDRLVHTIFTLTSMELSKNLPSTLSPYRSLFLPLSNEIKKEIAASWSIRSSSQNPNQDNIMSEAATLKSFFFTDDPLRQTKKIINVGYVSRRFEEYPGTQMMLQLFERHDRDRVRVVGFATGPDDSSIERQRVEETCDKFIDLSSPNLHIQDKFSAIVKEDVHILIDYDGGHDFNNLMVLFDETQTSDYIFFSFNFSSLVAWSESSTLAGDLVRISWDIRLGKRFKFCN